MDSHIPLAFFFFFLILSFSSAADRCADPTRSPSGSTDLSIFHLQSKCTQFSPSTHSPSEFDSILTSAKNDPARLSYLSSLLAAQQKPTNVPVASGLNFMQTNNYVVRTKFGTPGQLLFLALDTGSDTTWVPCAGCAGCQSSNASFTPAASSTYKPVDCGSAMCPQFKGLACAAATGTGAEPCGFNMSYGVDSFSVTLAQDSLRLATDVVGGYAFGCVNSATGGSSFAKQGSLGLGRGSSGLLAQSGSLYEVRTNLLFCFVLKFFNAIGFGF